MRLLRVKPRDHAEDGGRTAPILATQGGRRNGTIAFIRIDSVRNDLNLVGPDTLMLQREGDDLGALEGHAVGPGCSPAIEPQLQPRLVRIACRHGRE